MKCLLRALVTLGAILIHSEEIVTELSVVIARTETINSLYKEVKRISEETNEKSNTGGWFNFLWSFGRNPQTDSKSQEIVKRDSESVNDYKSEDSVFDIIMERANEFGGDIFDGSGEVFEEL